MPKRILQGTVTSDKNDQTITVLVERRFTHPVLKKTVRKSKKYRAHDAENTVQGRRQRPHHRMRADLEDQALGRSWRRRPPPRPDASFVETAGRRSPQVGSNQA